jgi:GTP cyclohydrolase II
MLRALGAPTVRLLSNNPDKTRQLTRCGVTVAAQLLTSVHLSATNSRYLAAKAHHGAHTLKLPDLGSTVSARSGQSARHPEGS